MTNIKSKFVLVGLDGRVTMRNMFRHLSNPEIKLTIRRKDRDGIYHYETYSHGDVVGTPEKKPRTVRMPKKSYTLSAEDSVFIRFGSREVIPTNSKTIVYNSAWKMKNASNKKLCRELLASGHARIPKLITPANVTKKDFPIIARPQCHHQGRDLHVLNNIEEYNEHRRNHFGWYYSKYIKKDNEYRVHVAHGKVLVINKKPHPADKNVIAWNQHQVGVDAGMWENIRWSEWNKPAIRDVVKQAIQAVKDIGLDFGGVDVMTKGRNAYILEINTAPSFATGDYVSGKYAKYFNALLSSEKRIPHVEVNSDNMMDYAWKNEELDSLGRWITINTTLNN